MKKRVAILGLYHESNSFSSVPTTWADFARDHLFYGQALMDRYQDAHHEIGGFLQELASPEFDCIPVFFADLLPAGPMDQESYSRLEQELLTRLHVQLPLDAVYAVVHGAAVSAQIADLDGHWLTRIRQLVGPGVPIVATLDAHANLSAAMVEATDGLIAYASNPHLDQRQTGQRAAALLRGLVQGKLRLKQELVQLPASLSLEQQNTNQEPCLSIYATLDALFHRPGILSYSFLLGFPYADVAEMGSSVVLISELECDTQGMLLEVKKRLEKLYPHFTGVKVTIQDVLNAKETFDTPVLLLDMGDNVGGGALGDSSHLLDALERAGRGKACICLYKPLLVEQVCQAGLGAELVLSFSTWEPTGEPSRYLVEVLELKEGRFFEREVRHGGQQEYDMGKVALVRTKLGNYIALTSLRVPPFSSQQLGMFDIDLSALHWIIAKGVNAPIAAYREICPQHIQVHSPGECNADATQFPYHFRRKPLYPFESLEEINMH